MIRQFQLTDIDQIRDIYNHYVINSIVTFDESPFTHSLMKAKLENIQKLSLPIFVSLCEKHMINGFAYASKWKEKSAYNQTVETTVYVKHATQGKGIGSLLYEKLLSELKRTNIHVAIGGLSLPNDESIALHEKFGFKKVAHFSEVGFKFGKWIDVGYWQKTL